MGEKEKKGEEGERGERERKGGRKREEEDMLMIHVYRLFLSGRVNCSASQSQTRGRTSARHAGCPESMSHIISTDS